MMQGPKTRLVVVLTGRSLLGAAHRILYRSGNPQLKHIFVHIKIFVVMLRSLLLEPAADGGCANGPAASFDLVSGPATPWHSAR